MRIKTIEIENFRSFPFATTFDLGGKNVLLYGENGSGKTSFTLALDELFKVSDLARDFEAFQNVFADVDTQPGFVRVTLDDDTMIEWSPDKGRPDDPIVVDASRRKAVLSYRDLLRIHQGGSDVGYRMFDLLVSVILADFEVSIGGVARKVWDLWKSILPSEPEIYEDMVLDSTSDQIEEFNSGFQQALDLLQAQVSHFLALLVQDDIKAKLRFSPVRFMEGTRYLEDPKVDFDVTVRGTNLTEVGQQWTEFFNESRLSALALAVYFASAHFHGALKDQSFTPLKIMVLDDVLVGLDMDNRHPVLKVLTEKFADWQIFLITFDKAWFQISKRVLPNARWHAIELYRGAIGVVNHTVVVNAKDDLQRARDFLEQGQVQAAAVHARVKFELLLKDACRKHHIEIDFSLRDDKITAGHLWPIVCNHEPKVIGTTVGPNRSPTGKLITEDLKARIQNALSDVLNPMSHSNPTQYYRGELEEALSALGDLERTLHAT